ncbi:hypothetical protein AVEN_237328-1 [Araneus ventricosus]|uniref:Uncharacterized protein n=1 Tax=Araneus ventricosus TaxID=182803 RepID=A0A4Y2IBX0_ARAVE|nr:hypothetical protein AVEN_237328-1 [Araneus ventricosus]
MPFKVATNKRYFLHTWETMRHEYRCEQTVFRAGSRATVYTCATDNLVSGRGCPPSIRRSVTLVCAIFIMDRIRSEWKCTLCGGSSDMKRNMLSPYEDFMKF